MIMAQYEKLVAYLREMGYYGDPKLEPMVDRLGTECEEADTTTNDLNEALTESLNGKRRYYGEDY